MSLRESLYLSCFRAAFQIYQIHNAFHKDLGLWEVEIILTIIDKQDIEANTTYSIFKTHKKMHSVILILLSSVYHLKMLFLLNYSTLYYEHMKFMRDFSSSWCFLCWCVWRSLSLWYGLHQVFLPTLFTCSLSPAGWLQCWDGRQQTPLGKFLRNNIHTTKMSKHFPGSVYTCNARVV